MKNLATTSLPSKMNVQGLILDQELVKKFDIDARKFSRNYEKSILLDQYNAGKLDDDLSPSLIQYYQS